MRSRRVGSITCGIVLIVFGILFLLHMMLPVISYTFIFRFWPLILVFLGLEIIIANTRKGENMMKYDIGAIFLIIVLAAFSLGMGLAEYCMSYYLQFSY